MKTLLLDGNPSTKRKKYINYLEKLKREIVKNGHDIEVHTLREKKIYYCRGCFECWWSNPGKCIFEDDSHKVCYDYINSDFVLFASPLIMGFISSEMKKAQEKLIPLLHPYMQIVKGECHHRKRYEEYPKIGLLMDKNPDTDDEDIKITTDIFKRFAINAWTDLSFAYTMDDNIKEVIDAVNNI